MSSCQLCYAMVEAGRAPAHMEWHRVHHLHAGDCASVILRLEQENTEAYLTPVECDCGLIPDVELPAKNELMLDANGVKVYHASQGSYVAAVEGYGWIQGSWFTPEEAMAAGRYSRARLETHYPDNVAMGT